MELNVTSATFDEQTMDADYPDIAILNAFGPSVQLGLIIMYAVTSLFSFVGNLSVIVVMLCGSKSSRDLRLLLINLAVSDISMAIFSMPFTFTLIVMNRWIFEPDFCPVVLTMQHCSVSVSVYTLTAIGIDRCESPNDEEPRQPLQKITCEIAFNAASIVYRYYAIIYPLKTAWTRSHGYIVVLVIWITAAISSIYQIVSSRAIPFSWGGKTYYDCRESYDPRIVTPLVFIFTFLIPLMLMTFCYAKIILQLKRKEIPGAIQQKCDRHPNRKKIKAIKMLSVVVMLFAICWIPLHLFMLCISFSPGLSEMSSESYKNIYMGLFITCHWLAMANSFVNPIIYSFMCENFRIDARNVLVCIGFKSFRGEDPFSTTWRRRTIDSRASTMTVNSTKLLSCKTSSPLNGYTAI